MKILRVTSDLYPYVVGGVGIHTHEMSSCQIKLGHDVTVFTLVADRETRGNETNYNLIKIRKLFTIFGNSVAPSLLIKIFLIRNDYDIIHAHSHLFLSTNICALVRRFGSAPLIITNHGLISQTAPMWLQKIFISTIAKWTFKSADKILCYTDVEKQQLISLGIRSDKIAVIHNGIDTQLFTPSSQKPGNQLLWIGRFSHGKGVEYLIEAFSIFLKSRPDYSLLMIGSGPMKKAIEDQILDRCLTNHIIIKEFVSNSEIAQVYQKSQVFILPSLEEGVPRTILESMSCGVPIICTNLPQLVNIVAGAGLLVPVQNATALAEALTIITSNPEKAKKIGECGRKRVLSSFSWDDTVKKTLGIYENLIFNHKK